MILDTIEVVVARMIRNVRYDWPCHFTLLLTNWLPDNVLFLRLRGALVRLFLGSCSSNLRLGRNVTFYNPSAIQLGRDVYIAQGCWFMAGAPIDVGSEVLFGPYCVVVSSNHRRKAGSFRYGQPDKSPISIGDGCWIAAHVTIAAGTKIGCGVLVAAGSVVTGDVDANVMVGGVPAHEVKRFVDGDTV